MSSPFYYDYFDEGSDTLITSHTSDSGHTYSESFSNAFTVGGGDGYAYGNGVGSAFCWPVIASTPSDDYYTEAVGVMGSTSGTARFCPMSRYDYNGGSYNGYRNLLFGSNLYEFGEMTNGTVTDFDSGAPGNTTTEELRNRVTCDGTTITAEIYSVDNDVVRAFFQTTDSDHSAGGPGIFHGSIGDVQQWRYIKAAVLRPTKRVVIRPRR